MEHYNFSPDRIYNCDDTGNSTVHNPTKIIAPIGTKQVGGMTSGKRGLNITMVGATNAVDNHVPSIFIFLKKYFKPHMLKGTPVGSYGDATPSGWINKELFLEFLQHFIKHTKPPVDDKILLIMYNHSSHIFIPVIDFSKKYGIILLIFTSTYISQTPATGLYCI